MAAASRVFTKRPDPPSDEVLTELEACEVAWVSDAASFGLMDGGIKALYPMTKRVVGTAITVKTLPGDFLVIPWALNLARKGDILVIDAGGETKRAVWGDYFSGWARAAGIEAVIIDGASRDRQAIERLDYPVFARATIPRQPTMNGPGEVNVPISCGGVSVSPGDVIIADTEGVAVVPHSNLDSALAGLREKVEQEKGLPEPSQENWPAFFGFFEKRGEVQVNECSWDESALKVPS
jgi:regulator of RNase E activity RraA